MDYCLATNSVDSLSMSHLAIDDFLIQGMQNASQHKLGTQGRYSLAGNLRNFVYLR